MQNNKKFWIGVVAGVFFLVLFFTTVDQGSLRDVLFSANYWFVVPAIGAYLVSVGFRALRWQWLLRHLRPISALRLYPVVVIGYMANNLMPMRLGELVRSYYVGEREGISKTSALVTIFVERLLDAFTLLLFIAVVALFAPVLGLVGAFEGRHGLFWLLVSIGLSAIFIFALVTLIFLAFRPSKARATIRLVARFLPSGMHAQVLDFGNLALDGLASLRSPKDILILCILSVPVWLLEVFLFYLIGFSFGLDLVYGGWVEMFVVMVLVTSVANIGSSIPMAPGGLGIFEWVARETLVLLPLATVDIAVATGFVAVVHFSLLMSMIILGQVFLLIHQVSLVSLSRRGQARTIEIEERSDSSFVEEEVS